VSEGSGSGATGVRRPAVTSAEPPTVELGDPAPTAAGVPGASTDSPLDMLLGRPEIAVGVAFAGGLFLRAVLRRRKRS
jgi:hypothetical protein